MPEEGTLRTLGAYRQIIDDLVADRHGRVFGSAGDSVVAEFTSPVEAVRCATAIQEEIGKRNAELPADRRMAYRIGVNLGDVVVKGDDLLGDGVNVAARLEELAEPGGICISGKVHDEIVGKADADFADAGEHHVKNIDRPVHVWGWPAVAAHALHRVSGRPWLRPGAIAGSLVVLAAIGGAFAWYSTLEAPGPKTYSPGDVFKDCDACPEMVVIPFPKPPPTAPPDDADSEPESHIAAYSLYMQPNLHACRW